MPVTSTSPDITALPISCPSSTTAAVPTPASQQVGLFKLEAESVITEPGPLLPTCHLDVVAIHGLNGNAYTTWTNKHNKLWLQDLLPASLPGARVYTFGYDSKIFSQSNSDIGDYARRLLSELDLVRQSEEVCKCRSVDISESETN